MAGARPQRAGDPMADRMNAIPKYVASRTLADTDLTWHHSTLLQADDAIGAVAALRESPGGDIQVLGTADLARQLIRHDLVDEYRLLLEPIVPAAARRSFSTTAWPGRSSS